MPERVQPTTSWICDQCGKAIASVGEGWLEWLRYRVAPGDAASGSHARIVHHVVASPQGGCYYNEDAALQAGATIADGHLESYLGPDGLMRLTELLLTRALPQDEVAELIRRLHVPGYEAARMLEARLSHVRNRETALFQDEIAEILDRQ